jgi:magnesium chelatase subunit I
VTAEHVDRVAEAVLVHRRHSRESQPRDHAGENGEQQRASQASSSVSADSSLAPAAAQSAPASSDNDWGYLPAEPTHTTRVKGVIPLGVKKR